MVAHPQYHSHAVVGHELWSAWAQWHGLGWAARQQVLRRAVTGVADPDPHHAAVARRFARAQLAVSGRTEIATLAGLAATAGLLVAALAGSATGDRIRAGALVAVTLMTLMLALLWTARGQAREIAAANAPVRVGPDPAGPATPSNPRPVSR